MQLGSHAKAKDVYDSDAFNWIRLDSFGFDWISFPSFSMQVRVRAIGEFKRNA